MKKTPCLYAIVRFAPFVETGEFANVGIVLITPEQRFFGYKLMIKRYGRVTNFFDQLDRRVYQETMYKLRDELERSLDIFKQHGFDRRLKDNDTDFAKYYFAEIIRPRETVIKFSAPRVVLTDNPAKKLEQLYQFYVERDFVTKQYQEKVMESGVRKLLFQADIGGLFHSMKIGNDSYHATFPFVEQQKDKAVKIIKPLRLDHSEPSKIIEHGDAWLARIKRLKRNNFLPEKVLFTVNGVDNRDERKDAFEEVIENLQDEGVNVIPYQKKESILAFAQSVD